jgi:hypothetical protein
MAFEERVDVHSELHDVRTSHKTLKIRFPTKRRNLEIHNKMPKKRIFQKDTAID